MAVNVYREWNDDLQLIGVLEGNRRDNASFRYDENYLESPDAHAVSLSLPLRSEPFDAEETRPYFDGLLPEGSSRTRIAAEVGCREEDYPILLAQCGLDCIGDVVIDPEAFLGERSYDPVSLANIAEDGRRVRRAAEMQHASRLSIAGVQNKVGLFHDESSDILGGWFKPVGGAPSNYIVKFANEELPDLIELEYLCITAAHGCGIGTAFAELLFPSKPVLCVRRFDRLASSDILVGGQRAPIRQHQEDMAQALGVFSSSKYAELEPSTAAVIASLLAEHSASPAVDIAAFARMSLYNYAIGNCDNHLKNFSLLYVPNWSSVRLAPAYDFTSTTHYSRFSAEMGMRIGSTRDIAAVEAADIRAFAGQLGVSENAIRRMAGEIAEQVVPAFKEAASHLAGNGFEDALYLFDELEEEFCPRLEILREAANK